MCVAEPDPEYGALMKSGSRMEKILDPGWKKYPDTEQTSQIIFLET